MGNLFGRAGASAAALGFGAACIALFVFSAFVTGDGYLQRVAIATGWLGTLALLFAGIGLIVGVALLWPDRLDKCWTQIDRILNSGSFYFFSGLALLLYAIHTTSNQTHPSLTFLLAMLGMAIMLFGTGSQAIGSIATAGARQLDPAKARERDPAAVATSDDPLKRAETAAQETLKAVKAAESLSTDAEKVAALAGLRTAAEETAKRAAEAVLAAPSAGSAGTVGDWHPFKANAAVAGGAAVLTALFGWGVIQFRGPIKEVFGFYDSYVTVLIRACAASAPTCTEVETGSAGGLVPDFTLTDYSVDAELINGEKLHLIQSGDQTQLLVFTQDFDQNIPIKVKFLRLQKNEKVGTGVDEEIELILQPKRIRQAASGSSPLPAAAGQSANSQTWCYQESNSKHVACALAFIDSNERADRLIYALNFYRPIDAPGDAEINGSKVSFE